MDHNDEEKLYFVVETKDSVLGELLRPIEKATIACGREHFKVLGEGASFTVAVNFEILWIRWEVKVLDDL